MFTTHHTFSLRAFFEARRSGYTHSSSSSDLTPAPSWSLSTGVRLFLWQHTGGSLPLLGDRVKGLLAVGNATTVSAHSHTLLKVWSKLGGSKSSLTVRTQAVHILLQALWCVAKYIISLHVNDIYTEQDMCLQCSWLTRPDCLTMFLITAVKKNE